MLLLVLKMEWNIVQVGMVPWTGPHMNISHKH
jgi:hypothetical protein